MENSSSQALGHMTPRVLKCREANLYTFIRGSKLELLKLEYFQICMFTVYYNPIFANLVEQNPFYRWHNNLNFEFQEGGHTAET